MRTQSPYSQAQSADLGIDSGLREYMNRIYSDMASGVLVTAATSWLVYASAVQNTTAGQALTGFGAALTSPVVMLIAALSPLIVSLLFSFASEKMSYGLMRVIYYVMTAAMGLSLSTIFMAFSATSLASVFLIAAIMFASLSIWGYVTKRDLGPVGAFLLVGLIGLIAASLINLFVGSQAISFATSVIGVLVFSGLIAWETQNAKLSYDAVNAVSAENVKKMALQYSLGLYVNFLNLFMSLLRLLGQNK